MKRIKWKLLTMITASIAVVGAALITPIAMLWKFTPDNTLYIIIPGNGGMSGGSLRYFRRTISKFSDDNIDRIRALGWSKIEVRELRTDYIGLTAYMKRAFSADLSPGAAYFSTAEAGSTALGFNKAIDLFSLPKEQSDIFRELSKDNIIVQQEQDLTEMAAERHQRLYSFPAGKSIAINQVSVPIFIHFIKSIDADPDVLEEVFKGRKDMFSLYAPKAATFAEVYERFQASNDFVPVTDKWTIREGFVADSVLIDLFKDPYLFDDFQRLKTFAVALKTQMLSPDSFPIFGLDSIDNMVFTSTFSAVDNDYNRYIMKLNPDTLRFESDLYTPNSEETESQRNLQRTTQDLLDLRDAGALYLRDPSASKTGYSNERLFDHRLPIVLSASSAGMQYAWKNEIQKEKVNGIDTEVNYSAFINPHEIYVPPGATGVYNAGKRKRSEAKDDGGFKNITLMQGFNFGLLDVGDMRVSSLMAEIFLKIYYDAQFYRESGYLPGTLMLRDEGAGTVYETMRAANIQWPAVLDIMRRSINADPETYIFTAPTTSMNSVLRSIARTQIYNGYLNRDQSARDIVALILQRFRMDFA